MRLPLSFFLPKNSIVYFAIWAFLFYYPPLYSQINEQETSYYDWFDNTVGQENSSLFNGILFVDTYKVINEKHHFLDSPDFMLGSVVYDGQMYYEQQLKYDLFTDELLVNPRGTSIALIVQLRKSNTEGFFLKDRKFIRVDKSEENKLATDLGFCEVLSERNGALLLNKHTKIMTSKRNNEFEYKEFYRSNRYYMVLDKTYYSVDSQSDWISIFPEYKKDIKALYRAYKTLRKTDNAAFQKLLFERFVENILQTDTK
ncbi:hypothetical protein N9954_02665 [Maribacter sp.]|nr:hypothetical protein [Maribacter sp.]